MKKIIMLSVGLLIIMTIVILFSRMNPTTKLNDSVVVCEASSTNRIMNLEDTQLIDEYNQHLLEEQKESELKQKKIEEVKNVKETNIIKTQRSYIYLVHKLDTYI